MEDIVIEKTSKTPAVHFSFQENWLEITGVSIPEDADTFYAPLMEWIDHYIEAKKNQPTTITLKLIYFNTSTSDYLVTMLKNLKKIKADDVESPYNSESSKEENLNHKVSDVQAEGLTETGTNQDAPNNGAKSISEDSKPEHPKNHKHPLRIVWYYEEEDEDMRETGSHFESIIDLPFDFQACEEID